MRVGIPKERKCQENRVGATPVQVAAIIEAGHKVCVEHDAGKAAGYPDNVYEASGARIGSAKDAYDADIVLKVKCPLPSEYSLLREDQVLFAFLHFDENIAPSQIKSIVETGVTAIAYEWVQQNGKFSILEPMSKISGAIFARRALELLMIHRGDLGGAYIPEVSPARAMVIGIGRMGATAAAVLARNGVRLLLVDKHPERINERIAMQWDKWDPKACVDKAIAFDENMPETGLEAIRQELPNVQIVIGCAVRRPSLPKSRCPYLIDREGTKSMPRGSVLCDGTACDKDLFETCVSSEDLLATYTDEGVLHYNCDHVPSLAAHTATELLAQASFPYVRLLLKGYKEALTCSKALADATMCYKGKFTHRYSAEKKGLLWSPLEALRP